MGSTRDGNGRDRRKARSNDGRRHTGSSMLVRPRERRIDAGRKLSNLGRWGRLRHAQSGNGGSISWFGREERYWRLLRDRLDGRRERCRPAVARIVIPVVQVSIIMIVCRGSGIGVVLWGLSISSLGLGGCIDRVGFVGGKRGSTSKRSHSESTEYRCKKSEIKGMWRYKERTPLG